MVTDRRWLLLEDRPSACLGNPMDRHRVNLNIAVHNGKLRANGFPSANDRVQWKLIRSRHEERLEELPQEIIVGLSAGASVDTVYVHFKLTRRCSSGLCLMLACRLRSFVKPLCCRRSRFSPSLSLSCRATSTKSPPMPPPSNTPKKPSEPRPSASVILINEHNEVLMVQRNPQSKSFAGAHVSLKTPSSNICSPYCIGRGLLATGRYSPAEITMLIKILQLL